MNGVASRIQVDTLLPVGELEAQPGIQRCVRRPSWSPFSWPLLSTSIATVIAAPLSFLAASNITKRGPLGTTVYYITRSFFNLTRSYDPLVMATVFAFWLGFGPFAGTLALTVVTIASLGKLFSEAVEGIDPGPIEALQATGANRLQVVIHSVIPQIVPDFVSYIVYHWDINVRISTVIGFVGGGGIGYYLRPADQLHGRLPPGRHGHLGDRRGGLGYGFPERRDTQETDYRPFPSENYESADGSPSALFCFRVQFPPVFKKRIKRFFTMLIKLLLILSGTAIAVLLVARLVTGLYARSRTYSAAEVPARRVAIVFGAGCGATALPPRCCRTASRPPRICISPARSRSC